MQHNAPLKLSSRNDATSFVRFVYAMNLKRLLHHLQNYWVFLIALDQSAQLGTSYLDSRYWIFLSVLHDNVNLYADALHLFDQRTGEIMYTMVKVILCGLCTD